MKNRREDAAEFVDSKQETKEVIHRLVSVIIRQVSTPSPFAA